MNISIKDITSKPDHSELFEASFDIESVEVNGASFSITDTQPFNICLSMIGSAKMHITGQTVVSLSANCDRCLSEVAISVPVEIDETVQISEGQVVTDDDIGPYPFVDGEDILVDELVYDEILVNFPAKILCQDDCKGLCPVCGKNKNLVNCSCDDTVLDPRMAQFLDFFKA